MFRRICLILILTAACLAVAAPAASAQSFAPGAPGIGTRTSRWRATGVTTCATTTSASRTDPATGGSIGSTLNKITATATQNLSRFDLDFQQLTVKGVDVNDNATTFTRDGQELVITPSRGIADGSTFTVNVRYAGVPETIVGSPIVFGSPMASSTPTTAPSWATSRTRRRHGSR